MAGKRGRSGPPDNLNAVAHGGYALKGRLNGTRMDRRSALFRAFMARVKEFVSSMGGDVSPQQMSIIHDTVKSEFYAEEKEAYLDRLKSRIRKGREHPLMEARRKDRAHIRENLKLIGLRRLPRDLPDLAKELQQLQVQEQGERLEGHAEGDRESCKR